MEDLSDLPPALIVMIDHDVWRDEGKGYAGRLMQPGVPATSPRFLGTVRDFMMINALAGSDATRNAIAGAGCALRYALPRRASALATPD